MERKRNQLIHFGVGARVRADPLRRVGNANAVALGLDLSGVSVISDRELMDIRRLAYEDDNMAQEQAQNAHKDARRKAASEAHAMKWPDTLESRCATFQTEQAKRLEEAEHRKQVLDELYRLRIEKERLASVAKLEMKNLNEDARGRNVKSMRMLHEALKGREGQIAFKQACKDHERQAEMQEMRELRQKLWGDAAEAAHLKLLERQRNLEEKNTNMEMVSSQITQRRQERADALAEREYLEQEAAQEQEENLAEEAARRLRNNEVNAFNAKLVKPYLTQRQKLLQRSTETAVEEMDLFSSKASQQMREHKRKKCAAFEKRKEAGLALYSQVATQPGPKHRTQDLFEEKFPSFLEKIQSGEEARLRAKEAMERPRKESCEAERPRKDSDSPVPGPSSSTYRKAAASAFGFLSEEEEKEYLKNAHLLSEQIRAEEAAEKASIRQTAMSLKTFQKQQAEEKARRDRTQKEMEREEFQTHLREIATDDAKYLDFIRSQIPEDMHPVLVKKSIQMG